MSFFHPVPVVFDGPYPYQGPSGLKAPVGSALRQVVDPEVALNIVDIGLIYGVTVVGTQVRVRMTMTTAACPVTDVIMSDVQVELEAALPAGFVVDVELVWEPAWGAERMSERAKAVMGW